MNLNRRAGALAGGMVVLALGADGACAQQTIRMATSWAGPLIGAILLGTLQQVATVTISSAVNVLIVGLLLVAFVIIAPNGIIGLVQAWRRRG